MGQNKFFRTDATIADTRANVTLTFSIDRIGRVESNGRWNALYIGGEMYYISDNAYKVLMDQLDVTDI